MEKNNEDMQKMILEMQEKAQTTVNQSDEMTQKMINANIELMNNRLKRSNDKNAEEMKKQKKELKKYLDLAEKLIRDKQKLNEDLEKTRQKLEKLEKRNLVMVVAVVIGFLKSLVIYLVIKQKSKTEN